MTRYRTRRAREPLPERVHRLVAVWAIIAVSVGAVAIAVDLRGGIEPVDGWLVAGITLLIAVSGALHLVVAIVPGLAKESTTLIEIGLVPAIVLLEPAVAIPVALLGGTIAEAIVTDRRAVKIVFNVSWQLLGVTVGGALFQWLAPAGFGPDGATIAAATIAGLAAVIVDLVAVSTVLAAVSHRALRGVMADQLVSSVFVDLVLALTGVLVALLIVVAPAALPLLLAPLLLYRGRARARSEGLREVEAERDRFERTVAGARDGVALLAHDGRVEVWNPAMEVMTGCAAAEVLGRRPIDVGLAGLVPPGSGVHRYGIGEAELDVRRSELAAGQGSVLIVQDISEDRELARIREDLVSRVSHELRTPLTTITGFLETLDTRWNELPDERRRDLLVVARRGTRRLDHLLDTLLMWSGIEARVSDGRGAPHGTGPTDVVACLERHLADDITLSRETPAEALPTYVAIEEDDLLTVVDQLLRNARLYGRPPIELRLEHDGSHVTLRVTDHGPGIPRELTNDLLAPFRQGVEGLRRTGRGLGLGLAIVNRLVTAVGGSLIIDQDSPVGASVVITLPVAGADDYS